MNEKKYFKVITINSERGVCENGQPYYYKSATVNFCGKLARAFCPENMEVKPWDFVKLGFSTRQSREGGEEIIATVVEVLKPEVKGA